MAGQWDPYVKNIKDHAKGNCDQATILGLKEGNPWVSATCPGALKVSPQEAAVLAKAFSRKKYDEFRTNGIRASGKRYIFLKSDDDGRVVYCRCSDETLVLQKSITALVIGHTPAGKQPGETNKAVDIVAKYLRSVNM